MLRILLLVGSLLLSQYSQAAFDSGQMDPFGQPSSAFVTVDQAFVFNSIQSGNKLNIDWQIKPGYYLYKKNIKINEKGVTSGPLTLPGGLPHRDEFFGQVEIYRDALFLSLSLNDIHPGATITIQYQGCADKGFCYPPETRTIALTPVKTADLPSPVSKQNQIASQLSDNYWTLFFMFALGIGLAFTPCVLPMYPILTSIVLGQRKLTRKQTFSLSFTYVQGMALTYTILGLIVASAGLQFQAYLQNPYILSTLSLLFILLSMSMFGLFSLQLPSSVQTLLNEWSNGQKGGTFWGVFVMGAISGLVCSPCTTAPLSGALIYVSQTGNLYIGGLALYLLALGMGVPLVAVALFGQQILPRSGMWMDKVKQLFGFILLSAPLFLLERILSSAVSSFLWALLAVSTIIWLLWATFRNNSGLKTKIVGMIVSAGITFITITGVLLPAWHESHSLAFIRITTVSQLEQHLKLARKDGKPVMMDFYADWCVACKEFEKYTFTDRSVQKALSGYILIQSDVTANSKNDQALLKHLHVLGLPTLLFWDQKGNTSPSTRVTGFMNADDFTEHLKQINHIQP